MKQFRLLAVVAMAMLALLTGPGAASAASATISAHMANNVVLQGQAGHVVGTVLPGSATGRVVVQRGVGGHWTDRQGGNVAGDGTFDIGIRPSESGIYSLRVRSNGGSVVSRTFHLRVGATPTSQPPATQPPVTSPPVTVPPTCTNGSYVNVDGNTVCSPVSSPSGPPAGATAQCNDGTYSFSQHHQGTCSGHGGVLTWL